MPLSSIYDQLIKHPNESYQCQFDNNELRPVIFENEEVFDTKKGFTKRMTHYINYVLRKQKPFANKFVIWSRLNNEYHPAVRSLNIKPISKSTVTLEFGPASTDFLANLVPEAEHSILNSMVDAVLISDAEPSSAPGPLVVYANHAFEVMTGYDRNQIIGKSPRILQGIETSAVVRQKIRDALKKWQPIQTELTNYRKDGSPFLVELHISPVFDETGWCTNWTSVQRDISKRIADETRANNIMKNVPGVIYQFQRSAANQMFFNFISPQGLSLLGLNEAEHNADLSLLIKMVHPDDGSRLLESIQESDRNLSKFRWQGRLLAKDGSTIWISASSSPTRLADGSTVWDGVMQDITEEVNLRTKLDERTNTDYHQERLAQIGEIAASVGHEIKNPLAIANGFVERIIRSLQKNGTIDAAIEAWYQKYSHASKRIANIVDGLRTVSRADQNEMSNLDIVETVKQSTDLLFEIYQKLSIALIVNAPQEKINIIADQGRLQQCFLNLIANAKDALHGRARATITVSITADQDFVVIDIADNGPGIPESVRSKIFTPFVTTKGVGVGTGLGLSTTMKLVKAMNGALDYKTGPDGTCFSMKFARTSATISTLPVERKDQNPKDISQQLKQISILVIEDEEDLRDIIKDYLSSRGLKVATVENGKVGLEKIKDSKFDLVFTDLQMPEMDGIEFIRQTNKLCAENNISHPPRIYIMSGLVEDGMLKEQLSTSDSKLLHGMITKPLNWSKIEEIFTDFLDVAA